MFYNKKMRILNPISNNYIIEKNLTTEDDIVNSEETMDSNEEYDQDYNKDYDEEFTSKYLYDYELLSAFDMINYDDKIINKKITELYNYLYLSRNSCPDIDKLLILAENISLQYTLKKDELQGLMILFSFDYFHITHLCICDIFNNEPFGYITKINMDFLDKIMNECPYK
jgi:hypothetical protein